MKEKYERMKNEFKTLKFYCHDIISPLFIRNDNDIPKEDLNHDLNLITDDEIKQFAEKNSHIVEIEKSRSKNDSIVKNELKYYILGEKLQKILGKSRIKCLLTTNLPYELDDLKDLKIDTEKLTSFNNFKVFYSTYCYKDNKYTLCLPINQNNSNYDLTLELIELNKLENVEIRIRLDPLIRNYEGHYIQKGKVYGKEIKWRELCKIYKKELIEFKDDKNGRLTEVFWERNNNEFHLKCEELPLPEEVEERGSRYFHAIYDIEKDLITHCDGSIKIYNKNELNNRYQKRLKDNPKNLGKKYLKIFKADGAINTEKFTQLIISFFRWNKDIEEYFNKTLD